MKRDYSNLQADRAYADLKKDLGRLPFRFTYRGVSYQGFSNQAITDCQTNCTVDRETTLYTFALMDGILEIRLLLTYYRSHGVTEWTVYFENVGKENSAILENVYSEIVFEGKYPNVKGILGDHINQYRPYCVDPTGNVLEFTSHTGQATHNNFPYFNLEYGDGGAMLAIGWAGTWEASFASDGERTTYRARAVNDMHLYLKPGECIRTALFTVAPYTKRNEFYATNYWRDWFVRHNLPKADAEGHGVQPFTTIWLELDTGLPHSDGSIAENYTTWRPSMEKLLSENLHFDFRWLDAGWYVAPDGRGAIPFEKGHDWWDTVGTWIPDPEKWPDGTLLESTEFARANGMKTLVWFEPERVTDPENLARNYGYDPAWAVPAVGRRGICNNIGDPACLAWTTARICRMLRENRVELYREDHNFKSAYLWHALDHEQGEDRRGITECSVVTAHYKMWDDIIACTMGHGGCGFVDSCASGGGRNDLESLRRALPLLRSDSDRKGIAHRLSMSSSFNKWIPFNGAGGIGDNPTNDPFGIGITDLYSVRASYLPCMHISTIQPTQKPDTDFAFYRNMLAEWKRVAPYLLKEFYVLTPWHKEIDRTKHGEIDHTDYTVFCYFDSETEKGVLLGFREQDCAKPVFTLSLPFAEKGTRYRLTDEDSGARTDYEEFMQLDFSSPRTSRLIWIEKLDS